MAKRTVGFDRRHGDGFDKSDKVAATSFGPH